MVEKTQNQKFNFNNFLVKIDRCSAWVLFVVALLYAITGYGMTKGIIDQNISRFLHMNWLGVIGLITFVVHTSRAIYLALLRWNMWNNISKILLILFFSGLVLFFLYVHFFGVISVTTNEKVFTAETLSIYNGQNGQPSYVAVDGIVYDVSSLFVNGVHRDCLAGQDVSDDFNQERKHFTAMLAQYKIVGTYK